MLYRFVSWALGPSGLQILEWYAAHQLIVNAIIVILALLAIAFPRQGARISIILRNAWQKTPFALSEEDRKLVEEYRDRARKRAGLSPTDKSVKKKGKRTK